MPRLIAEVNLSQYFVGGKSWLHGVLKSLHKPVYEDDERMLFYLDVSDIYKYDDERGEIEQCLDQFLHELDIPEYFVIKRFAPTKTVETYQDTKCIFPWMQLYFDPLGNQAPCCYSSGKFGRITDHETVNAAMNTDQFKQLRLTMLQNKRHRSCAMCYESEDMGVASERQLNTYNRFAKYAYLFDQTQPDGTIKDFSTRYAVIGLDNICNFKCRICHNELSSRIESEDLKLGLLDKPLIKNKNHASFTVFIEDFKQQLNNIDKLHFFGGEPLLMDQHYEMLDALLAHSNHDLELMYHTNLSVLAHRHNQVLDYWQQFSNVSVIASIDAEGSRAEYLRHGTKWIDILNNVKLIRNILPAVSLRVDTTVSIYNALHVTDLHQSLLEDGLFACNEIELHYARGDMNDPRMLPNSLKEQAVQSMQQFMVYVASHKDAELLTQYYQDMITYLLSEDRSYNLPSFVQRVKKIDRYRQEDFATVFPELKSIIDFN